MKSGCRPRVAGLKVVPPGARCTGLHKLRTTMVVGLLALVAGSSGCRPSTATPPDPAPELIATGSCLGRLCLGMSETAALAAIDAPALPASVDDRRCFRFEEADLDLSFEVDAADARRPLRAILVTSLPHCSAPADGTRSAADGGAVPAGGVGVGGAVQAGGVGRIADCRGLRPGDPESFANKVHRHASPIAGVDPWRAAPDGVRGFEDICEPAAADSARSGHYLRDGRVVGVAVWRP